MKILVLDNYDSFTFNLVQLVKNCMKANIEVHRNDKIELEEIKKFDKILLSPGPGLPQEAGILKELINVYASSKSILGVCLGHQAIAETFHATLLNLPQVFHGVATSIRILKNDHLFMHLPAQIKAGRYHSWVVSPVNFPPVLEVTALDENNHIMALKHVSLDVSGVQFHPESILTPMGKKIIENWLAQ